jgi:hypothetical protein
MISLVMNETNQIEKKQERVEQKIVNGVDVTKLFGTIDAIRSSPIISKFNFRAKGKWIKGGHNQISLLGNMKFFVCLSFIIMRNYFLSESLHLFVLIAVSFTIKTT